VCDITAHCIISPQIAPTGLVARSVARRKHPIAAPTLTANPSAVVARLTETNAIASVSGDDHHIPYSVYGSLSIFWARTAKGSEEGHWT